MSVKLACVCDPRFGFNKPPHVLIIEDWCSHYSDSHCFLIGNYRGTEEGKDTKLKPPCAFYGLSRA